MPEKNEELIETFDEEGNKVTFELLDIVTVDNIEYALLLPKCGGHCDCDEHNHNQEEPEVLVMRLKKDGEEYSFETIEDDNEFDKVAQYIEKIEDEIEE